LKVVVTNVVSTNLQRSNARSDNYALATSKER